MSRHRFLGAISALLVAGAGTPAMAADPAPPPRAEARRAASAELAELAIRIEKLKREAAAGRPARAELERLLRRAQELAASLDRTGRGAGPAPALRPAGPDPQELRERADALRDRADRMAAALAEVDRRLAEARRQAELERRLEAVGDPGDLFAESSPRRTWAGSPAVDRAPPGGPATPSSTPPSASGPTASPTVPQPLPAQVVAPASGDASAPGPDDSVEVLRRKRAGLSAELDTLRTQARALEAEAEVLDKAR